MGILLPSYCRRMTSRLEGGDCLTLECLCPCHLRSIWNLQTSPLQWVSKVFCVNLVLSHFGIDLTKSKHFSLNLWGWSHFGTSSVPSLCTSPPPSDRYGICKRQRCNDFDHFEHKFSASAFHLFVCGRKIFFKCFSFEFDLCGREFWDSTKTPQSRSSQSKSWRPMLPMSCFVKENAKGVALSRFWFNLTVWQTRSIEREQNGTYADTQPRHNKTVDDASIAIQNDNLVHQRCAAFRSLLSGSQALV